MSKESERLGWVRWRIERLLESRASWNPEQREEYDALIREESLLLDLREDRENEAEAQGGKSR